MNRVMNENEQEVCERILSALLKRPISTLFWDDITDVTNPSVAHPLSLRWVSELLSAHKFSSPSDFIQDLRTCLTNGKVGSRVGSIREAAAEQLLEDLNELINIYQPTAPSSVLPLRFITHDFEMSCSLPEDRVLKRDLKKEPISFVFHSDDDESTLARDIRFLSSQDLVAKLAVFIQRKQPEVVIVDRDLSFNLSLMSAETRKSVRKYVSDLLRDAASGKIDPFSRPFGTKLPKVRIHERGMYIQRVQL